MAMERMGTDGLHQPSPPGSLFCCPCQAWEDPLQWNSTGQQVGRARQLHSDSTDGVWTWGAREAQDCTSREACLAPQPLPEMGSPLALEGSQKPGGLAVGPGWASRLSVQAPQEDLHR